jgi:hypothetical protein
MFDLKLFLLGVIGALGIEAIRIYRRMISDTVYSFKHPINIKTYWIILSIVVILAGFIAMIFANDSLIVALQMGAFVPLLLNFLLRSNKSQVGVDDIDSFGVEYKKTDNFVMKKMKMYFDEQKENDND